MKVVAKPNPKYRWYNNFHNVEFFAEITNGRVTFYLVEDGNVKQVSQEFVRKFFPEEKRLKDRPFTKKGNRNFYTVLYRNKKQYYNAFQALVKSSIIIKFKRTK